MIYRIISALLLLSVTTAYANDAAFSGSGASPMPISRSDVKMQSEKIIIKGYRLDRMDKGAWHYSCQYNFENMTGKQLDFKMGFPFDIRDGEVDFAIPKGRTLKQGSPLIYNFKVQANSKPVSAIIKKVSMNPKIQSYFTHAYIWDIKFKPHQKITINHQYTTGAEFFSEGLARVKYILQTGGLWRGGKIGHAVIKVIPGVPTLLCSEDPKFAKDFKPMKGMKIVTVNGLRQYEWSLYNFKPAEDINLCLIIGKKIKSNYWKDQIK